MPLDPDTHPSAKAVKQAIVNKYPRLITENLDSEFRSAVAIKNDVGLIANQLSAVLGTGAGVKKFVPTGMRRVGSTFTIDRGMSRNASFTADRVFDVPHNPFRSRQAIETPQNLVELYQRFRYYFQREPLVGTAIELHSEFPLSQFQLTHEDAVLQEEFNDIAEDLNLFEFQIDMAMEYYLIGECLKKGTLITLGDYSVKNIEDIKRGDKVITHLGNVKEVLELKINNTEEFYRISFNGKNVPLEVTGKHPLYLYKRDRHKCFYKNNLEGLSLIPACLPITKCSCGTYNQPQHKSECPHKVKEWQAEWVKASEASKGDYLVLPINKEEIEVEGMTLDKARFLGYYLSEGSLRFNFENESGVTISNSNDSLLEDIERCSISTYGKVRKSKPIYSEKSTKPCYNLTIDSKDICKEIFNYCGRYCGEKLISNAIMKMPIKYQEELLIGYLNGDGWVDKSTGAMQVLTTSKNLAEQIRLILLRVGVVATIRNKILKQSKSSILQLNQQYLNNAAKIGYIISIRPSDSIRWKNLTRHNVDNYKETTKRPSRCFIYDNKLFQPIIKIEKYKSKEVVYNLEVKDDHSYIAGGVAVHNCFPFGIFDDPKQPSMWKNFILLNPLNVEIANAPITDGRNSELVRLRIDDVIKNIIKNGPNHKETGALYNRIPEDIKVSVKGGDGTIKLNEVQVSHFKRKGNYFKVRGESMLYRIIHLLSYRDKMRDAQYSICDRNVTPREVWKLGETGNPASEEELQSFSDMLSSTYLDPNQAIVGHHAISVDVISGGDKLMPLRQELDGVESEMLTGLMLNKGFLDSSYGAYANMSVALDVLIARYLTFRQRIERWQREHVWAPLCRIHEIYKPTQAEIAHRIRIKDANKRPWVPKVSWDKQELKDPSQKINLMMMLRDKLGKPGFPKDLIYQSMNVNPRTIKQMLAKEAKEDTINKNNVNLGKPSGPGGGLGDLSMDQSMGGADNISVPGGSSGSGGGGPTGQTLDTSKLPEFNGAGNSQDVNKVMPPASQKITNDKSPVT